MGKSKFVYEVTRDLLHNPPRYRELCFTGTPANCDKIIIIGHSVWAKGFYERCIVEKSCQIKTRSNVLYQSPVQKQSEIDAN